MLFIYLQHSLKRLLSWLGSLSQVVGGGFSVLMTYRCACRKRVPVFLVGDDCAYVLITIRNIKVNQLCVQPLLISLSFFIPCSNLPFCWTLTEIAGAPGVFAMTAADLLAPQKLANMQICLLSLQHFLG
jgi:hypothetical protein